MLGLQSDQAREPLHHDRIVAGQDLQPDPGAGEPGDRRGRGRLGRIGEGAEPFEHEVALVRGLDLAGRSGPWARGHGDGRKPVAGQRVDALDAPAARPFASIAVDVRRRPLPRAERQHRLRARP